MNERQADKMRCDGVSIYYGDIRAIDEVTLAFPPSSVTALVGPSGCGKSTLLRALNRLHETVDNARVEGSITLQGQDIYAPDVDPVAIRRKIGMVFQKSNPFPKSIFDNVAFGLRIAGVTDPEELRGRVVASLKSAALWKEVEDRLDSSAMALSGGQQQRLCIARTLAVEPEVILMDEPASALDPIATAAIEDLVVKLEKELTIILVTHSLPQAARIADYTAFFYLGRLIEHGETARLFERPEHQRTREYLTGRFG